MITINRLSIAVVGLFFSASSLAARSGTLVYAPVLGQSSSTPIPTLSETMLILLSLLLVLIVFRVKQKSDSNTLMLVLIGVLSTGAIFSSTLGIKFISDVSADGNGGGAVVVQLSSRTGGQGPIQENQLSIFENTSGEDQRVIEINRPENCPNADGGLIQGVARCNVGAVIPTTIHGMCYIDCRLLQANISSSTHSG